MTAWKKGNANLFCLFLVEIHTPFLGGILRLFGGYVGTDGDVGTGGNKGVSVSVSNCSCFIFKREREGERRMTTSGLFCRFLAAWNLHKVAQRTTRGVSKRVELCRFILVFFALLTHTADPNKPCATVLVRKDNTKKGSFSFPFVLPSSYRTNPDAFCCPGQGGGLE